VGSWYEAPEAIKQLLNSAADNWENTERSQTFIQQALEVAGHQPDVLISAYRYFFYKQNYPLSLQIAQQVMDSVRQVEQLPEDWQQLRPILLARREDPNIRLYLNAYAASGFMLARLGELDQATEIAAHVSELDQQREFGGQVVLDVLTRSPDEDD
jgi:DNA-binding NarL/FixJ family response regulator